MIFGASFKFFPALAHICSFINIILTKLYFLLNSFIMASTEADLKAFIQHRYDQLFTAWRCFIPFPAYVQDTFVSDCDILQYVGRKAYKNQLSSVRFCPIKYPVKQGFDGKAFKELSIDIGRAAIDNGFQIAKNGNYPFTPNNSKQKVKLTAKRFSCVHNSTYRGNAKYRQDMTYRDHTYHNDRKNTRGAFGLTYCRRSNTMKSYCKHTSCSFFFSYSSRRYLFLCCKWFRQCSTLLSFSVIKGSSELSSSFVKGYGKRIN